MRARGYFSLGQVRAAMFAFGFSAQSGRRNTVADLDPLCIEREPAPRIQSEEPPSLRFPASGEANTVWAQQSRAQCALLRHRAALFARLLASKHTERRIIYIMCYLAIHPHRSINRASLGKHFPASRPIEELVKSFSLIVWPERPKRLWGCRLLGSVASFSLRHFQR